MRIKGPIITARHAVSRLSSSVIPPRRLGDETSLLLVALASDPYSYIACYACTFSNMSGRIEYLRPLRIPLLLPLSEVFCDAVDLFLQMLDLLLVVLENLETN